MISTRVLIDSPPGEKILPKWCLNPRGDDLSPREEYLLQNLTEVPIDSPGGLFFPQISFTQSWSKEVFSGGEEKGFEIPGELLLEE